MDRTTASPPSWSSRLARLFSTSGSACLVTFAAFAASATSLVVRWRDQFVPVSDPAITELAVRDVGRYAVLIGPYSRFGWYHPGPLLFYLLALPYRLLGGRSIGLAVGCALIAGISATGVVFVAARRGGRALAWWSALVMAVFVWSMGPELLRYPWNPYVIVLPMALLVMLAWSVAARDAWAIPASLGVGTFLIQTHVGTTPVVVSVLGVAGGVLVFRLVRERRMPERSTERGRTVRAALVGAVILLVLWAPVAVQQLTNEPGNLGELVAFFRENDPDHGLGEGARVTYRQLGGVVAQISRHRTGWAVGRAMPAWSNLLTLAALGASAYAAIRRRATSVTILLALTATLLATSVWSVSRVVGELEPYLVQWIAIVSPVAWIAIGAGGQSALAASKERPPMLRATGAGIVVAALVLAAVNTWSAVRALPPDAQLTPAARRLTQDAIQALPRDTRGPVLIRIDDQVTWSWAATIALELERAGVPWRVERRNGWLISDRLATDATGFPTQLTVTLEGQPGTDRARANPRQVQIASQRDGVLVFLARG